MNVYVYIHICCKHFNVYFFVFQFKGCKVNRKIEDEQYRKATVILIIWHVFCTHHNVTQAFYQRLLDHAFTRHADFTLSSILCDSSQVQV